MGCGASSANNGRVAEPQRLAPGPSSTAGEVAPPSGSVIHVLAQASSPPRPAEPAGTEPAGGSAQRPQACSPLSAARLSGAATPVLGASYKSNCSTELEDQLVDVEGEEDYQVRTHSITGSLNGESRLLKFEEPSLQARVDQLQNHVQTQIFGKTSSALRMPLLGADDEDEEEEDEEMNELYDMPPSSELDASWRSKIFSYDGTDVPDAILSKIMLDTRWAKEVQIKSCKVGLEEVNFLDNLVQDRELRALTLARCNLEDDVAVQLSRFLGSGGWKSIHTLGFDGNQMVGDAAAEALAQALLTNTTLHELSLWGTGVGDAGAKSLATALKKNTTLKNLWLGECEGITDEGARVLMEAISANSTLNQLALVMTGVSDELQNEIEALLATCREQQAQTLGASRIGSGQEENEVAVPAS